MVLFEIFIINLLIKNNFFKLYFIIIFLHFSKINATIFIYNFLSPYIMLENFWKYNKYIDEVDVKWDKIPNWFNENQIKDKAIEYVEKRISEWISNEEYEKLLQNIKTLLERQNIERLNIREELERQVISETREELDKEALIQEVKTILYEKLWINEDQNKNSRTENFLKWIVEMSL